MLSEYRQKRSDSMPLQWASMLLMATSRRVLMAMMAVLLCHATMWAEETAQGVNYISGSSNLQSDAYVLESSTTTFKASSFYVVNNDLAYDSGLTLSGDAGLIIVDGTTVTINGSVTGSHQLAVYGQSAGSGAGKLVLGSSLTGTLGGLKIGSGNVSSAANINCTGNVYIYGGQVDVSGNSISSTGGIYLGWGYATDFVIAGGYSATTVSFNKPFAVYDISSNTETLSTVLGMGSVANTTTIAGKMLRPAAGITSLPSDVTATVGGQSFKGVADNAIGTQVPLAPVGATVTLSPASGKAFTSPPVVKMNETTVEVSAAAGGAYTFVMPAGNVEVSGVQKPGIQDSWITLSNTFFTYTGSGIEPAVTLKDGDTTIDASAYTVSYSNNVNAAAATSAQAPTVTVTMKADADSYAGSAQATFTILPKTTGYGAITITDYGSSKTAAIDGTSTEATSITTAIEVDAVEINRTFTSGVASTVILPFGIAVDKVSGGTFYTFTSVDETKSPWKVMYAEVTGSLTANTPYVFMPGGTQMTVDNGTDKLSLQTADGSTKPDGVDWTFSGTYSPIAWTEGHADLGKVYGFAAQDYSEGNVSAGNFVKAAAGASIAPLRAYLKRTTAYSGTRASEATLPDRLQVVLIGADGEATSLNDAFWQKGHGSANENGDVEGSAGSYYDLSGRKLAGKPSKKGVYVSNGRLVVVR